MKKSKKILLLSIGIKGGFGGSLQSYALEKKIKDSQPLCSCCYLDYAFPLKKHAFIWLLRKFLYGISFRNNTPDLTLKESFSMMKTQTKNEALYNNSLEKFNEFWNLSSYTKKIKRQNLFILESKFDMFVVGSDQTWNCGRLNFDGTFFLDFVKNEKKKYSYAPSLALKSIPQKYSKKYFSCLKNFQFLSCREKIGATVLSEFLNRDVTAVLDPVFLLSKNEWKELSKNASGCEKKDPYILVYIIDQSKSLDDLALSYEKKTSMTVIKIYGDQELNDAIGPFEWLSLFNNATLILTNSFHGTAFSCIFEKQFFSEITDTERFKFMSSRITELLDDFSLQNRLIAKRTIDELLSEPAIDYGIVKPLMKTCIDKSCLYLDEMLKKGLE